jgi:hypothetical protein
VELLGDREEVADPAQMHGRKYNTRRVSFVGENVLDISLPGCLSRLHGEVAAMTEGVAPSVLPPARS